MILPNGLHYLNRRNTLLLYEEIFVDGIYNFPELIINPGDTIIDVGANIGLFALWVFQRQIECRIICFEPNIEAFKILQSNVFGNVRFHNIALTDTNGYAEFTVYPRLPELSTLYPNLDTIQERNTWHTYLNRRFGRFLSSIIRWWLFKKQTTIVPCMTLKDVFLGQINLLKIDAEKSEQKILAGVGDWSRVCQVLVENHLGADGEQHIERILKDAGFSVKWRQCSTFVELGCRVAFGYRR